MRFAKETEAKDIMKIFRKYPKIFSHIRGDRVLNKIKKNRVIYDNGVVIIFTPYQKAQQLGTYRAIKGEVCINQIVAQNTGTGEAKLVMENFFSEFSNRVIILTVRADNDRACSFYEKLGFRVAGQISWKEDTITGVVYRKNLES